MGMTALQLVGLIYLKAVLMDHDAPVTAFAPDGLSLIMVIIISVVGGLITIYGLGYMDIHEEHLHLRTSRQPRFFAIIFCFLGAMNGLVLCNNLSWMFFFWERPRSVPSGSSATTAPRRPRPTPTGPCG